MTTTKLTAGKLAGLKAVSDARGGIAAAAMDQRGSLKKSLAKEKGVSDLPAAALVGVKELVNEVLPRYSSAILLDPEYGLPASKKRHGKGLLLAYEKTGYDADQPGRLPDLLNHWPVRRLKEAGADCIKVLLYYTAFEKTDVNAKKKREIVYGSMSEFGKEKYLIDVLKVEVPVQMEFVQGTKSFKGEAAYTRGEALHHFQDAASATHKPFIYLSAGVSNAVFTETLELAVESGTSFNGVLCGRATWKDGIAVYAKSGAKAFEAWLNDQGVKNIQNVNHSLIGAHSWFPKVGVTAKDLAL